jgi:hypothetical protein
VGIFPKMQGILTKLRERHHTFNLLVEVTSFVIQMPGNIDLH